MNGIHDMGGMQGFGPIDVEENEPVFHDDWERRTFGMALMAILMEAINWDDARHGIERMTASNYLNTTYYEHWLSSVETLVVEKGVMSRDEIAARMQELEAAGTQESK